MTIELFVPLKGYEGLYEVSSLGRIKSLPKQRGTNYKCYIPERIMSSKDNGNGYHQIALSKNSRKTTLYVHILVASHFVDNPDNLPEVNHDNGDKSCNESWNLKWCTRKANEEHAWKTGLKSMRGDNHHSSKRVLQMDFEGNVIKEWTNGHEVMNVLGYAHGHIGKCCRGLAKTAYGFRWQYKKVS